MAACGLKQAALAQALDVPLDRVKSLTSGKVSKLTPKEMRAFVEKLHVRPEFLATGEGSVLLSDSDRQFEERLKVLREATDTATSLPLPRDYQGLVRDILVGSALRNPEMLRETIDLFLANEVMSRLGLSGQSASVVTEASTKKPRRKKPR